WSTNPLKSEWLIEQANNRRYYTFIAPIKNPNNFDIIGYARLQFYLLAITNVEETSSLKPGSELLILNNKDDIMYSTIPSRIGEKLDQQYEDSLNNISSSEFIYFKDEELNSIVWAKGFSKIDWKSLIIVPKAQIEVELRKLQRNTILIGAAASIVF